MPTMFTTGQRVIVTLGAVALAVVAWPRDMAVRRAATADAAYGAEFVAEAARQRATDPKRPFVSDSVRLWLQFSATNPVLFRDSLAVVRQRDADFVASRIRETREHLGRARLGERVAYLRMGASILLVAALVVSWWRYFGRSGTS